MTQEDVRSKYIDAMHGVFLMWFGLKYDLDALDIALCTVACERLPGDPPWTLEISGSGNAKTEKIYSLQGITPKPLLVSSITGEAALLSAANGGGRGILETVGDRGIILIKDFTTILEMNKDARKTVLSALREIYDGKYSRDAGINGGRRVEWEGRIIVVGAVTGAYDKHHSVIASMGPRFLTIRTDSSSRDVRKSAQKHALANSGNEIEMRQQLVVAVSKVFHSMKPEQAFLDQGAAKTLGEVSDIVTLGRTPVTLDYKGNVIDKDYPEMPTRFTKMLGQIYKAALALGYSKRHALDLAIRVARDSLPPMRLTVLRYLFEHPESMIMDMVKNLNLPRHSVSVACQSLQILQLITMKEEGDLTQKYRISDYVDLEYLALLVSK